MPYTSSDQVPRGVLKNDGTVTEKNYREKLQTQNLLKKNRHWVTILTY